MFRLLYELGASDAFGVAPIATPLAAPLAAAAPCGPVPATAES